jgi:lysophospholipid acyltransferase (LPLAT)-like uncharacterized protein
VNSSAPPSSKRPAQRSGVVIPRQPEWHGRLAASALWALTKVLASTWRTTIRDESGLIVRHNQEPAIFAIWHNRLSIAMCIWAWGRRRQPHARLAALISASRDGGLLAKTFSNFGVLPIRGSSSRRGAQALLESARALRQGCHLAITPDGPRGPKYTVEPGIISLAQVSGCPVIPVGARIHPKMQLRSWDGFQIPLPLSRCELVLGEPIRIPREATDEERARVRLELESALRRLNPD